MKTCPKCSMNLPDTAIRCSMCGTAQPMPKARTGYKKSLARTELWFGVAAVGVTVAGLVLILWMNSRPPSTRARSQPRPTTARQDAPTTHAKPRSAPARPRRDSAAIADAKWVKAPGHLYTGVVLYVGSKGGTRTRVGTVLGGNDRYRDPRTGQTYRGVKVWFDSGRIEWRDRTDMIRAGTWWVRRDDPALEREAWKVLRE